MKFEKSKTVVLKHATTYVDVDCVDYVFRRITGLLALNYAKQSTRSKCREKIRKFLNDNGIDEKISMHVSWEADTHIRSSNHQLLKKGQTCLLIDTKRTAVDSLIIDPYTFNVSRYPYCALYGERPNDSVVLQLSNRKSCIALIDGKLVSFPSMRFFEEIEDVQKRIDELDIELVTKFNIKIKNKSLEQLNKCIVSRVERLNKKYAQDFTVTAVKVSKNKRIKIDTSKLVDDLNKTLEDSFKKGKKK